MFIRAPISLAYPCGLTAVQDLTADLHVGTVSHFAPHAAVLGKRISLTWRGYNAHGGQPCKYPIASCCVRVQEFSVERGTERHLEILLHGID